MGTAAVSGRSGALYFSTNLSAATSAMTKVAELRDATLRFTRKTIDVTSHDSSGFQEILAGIGDWKVTGKISYFSTMAAMKTVVINLLTAGNSVPSLRVSVAATTSKTAHLFQGNGKVTSFEQTMPYDKEQAGSIEFVGTGSLTRTS